MAINLGVCLGKRYILIQ